MCSNPSGNAAVSTVRRSRSALLSLVVGFALVISACGSDDESTTTSGVQAEQTPDTPDGQQNPDRSGFPGGLGGFPGGSGLVAAIDGTTLQVQGGSGQTAVTYTDATKITETVTGSAADVAVGACVLVRTDGPRGELASEVNAASVAVTWPADDGSCQAGFGGGAGFSGGEGGPPVGMPTGRPGGAPSGLPSDFPSDGPRSGGRFGGGTSGVVTAVNDGSFIVEATTFQVPGGDTASPEPTTSTVTVATSESTTWTVEVVAGPEALAEGVCVTAIGEADDTGAVTADSIAVRPAQDGECPAVRGGGGGA